MQRAALRKPLDPTVLIDQLREEMRTELAALDASLPKLPWLEIAGRGRAADAGDLCLRHQRRHPSRRPYGEVKLDMTSLLVLATDARVRSRREGTFRINRC